MNNLLKLLIISIVALISVTDSFAAGTHQDPPEQYNRIILKRTLTVLEGLLEQVSEPETPVDDELVFLLWNGKTSVQKVVSKLERESKNLRILSAELRSRDEDGNLNRSSKKAVREDFKEEVKEQRDLIENALEYSRSSLNDAEYFISQYRSNYLKKSELQHILEDYVNDAKDELATGGNGTERGGSGN